MIDGKQILNEKQYLKNYDRTDLLKRVNVEYPSIRTRLRSMLFLTIASNRLINRSILNKLGFSNKIIATFISDAKNDNLICERSFFLSLKDEGKAVIIDILRDPFISTWYNSIYEKSDIKISIAGS